MFIHRHPRHHLARLLPAGLRVTALFALPVAAAVLLGGPSGTTPRSLPPTSLGNGATQLAQAAHPQPATPRATPHATH